MKTCPRNLAKHLAATISVLSVVLFLSSGCCPHRNAASTQRGSVQWMTASAVQEPQGKLPGERAEAKHEK